MSIEIVTSGATVMIVDDNPKNVQVLGTILMEKKYNVSVATGGKQALAQVGKVKPEVILLDIMMPDIDGYEVCRRLKEKEETADIPVIFLTAKTDTDDIVKGFELGAVDYVTKPFKSKELIARVHTHIANTRMRNHLEQRNKELEEALHDVRTLSGLLPICSGCKKIRDEEGHWIQVELFIRDRIDVEFSHGICPDCAKTYFEFVKKD